MPSWTAEMDRKLLLAILKVHDFTIDKAKVADELNTEDEPVTTMAIQKRLQAIKNMITDRSGNSSPKAKGSPRKRAAAATSTDESPAKKAKAKTKAMEEDDDEAEQDAVKSEDAEEDELSF